MKFDDQNQGELEMNYSIHLFITRQLWIMKQ